MKLPVQINFYNLPASSPLKDYIQQKAEALERYDTPITSCRIFVDANTRHLQGNVFYVHIDVNASGNRLVVSREPAKNIECEDAYLAVREAFESIHSQLACLEQRDRGSFNEHEMVFG